MRAKEREREMPVRHTESKINYLRERKKERGRERERKKEKER